MSQLIDIKVPDIGDFPDVPIIDIYAKPPVTPWRRTVHWRHGFNVYIAQLLADFRRTVL